MRYLEFGRDTQAHTIDATPGAEGLTVADYILYVNPEHYAPHRNTLSSIEFYGATIFDNIRQVLISCPKMRELTLTHVYIDEYQRCPISFPTSSSENVDHHHLVNILDESSSTTTSNSSLIPSSKFSVEARNLTTIEFNNDRNITKDELIIIDYLLNNVNLPALKSFLFNTMTYGFHPKIWVTEVMEMYGQQLPWATLAHFLVKCSGTLRTFSVRRHEFVFYSNSNSNHQNSMKEAITSRDHNYASDLNQNQVQAGKLEILDALSLVKLTKIRFQCDTVGIHHLLNLQSNLERLDCYSHFDVSCLHISKFLPLKKSIEQSVQNSSETLKQAHTIGIISFPKCQLDTFDHDREIHTKESKNSIDFEFFVTDLKVFKDCVKLTNLWVAKMENRCSSKEEENNNSSHISFDPNLKPIFHEKFTFINAQYLPTSLFQLELWVGHVIPEELITLTLKFREMINLHYFRLTSATVFTISEECFKNIIDISDSWIQAHFYNGLLADNFCPQQLLLVGHRPEAARNWEVKISDCGCEFLCRESKIYF